MTTAPDTIYQEKIYTLDLNANNLDPTVSLGPKTKKRICDLKRNNSINDNTNNKFLNFKRNPTSNDKNFNRLVGVCSSPQFLDHHLT